MLEIKEAQALILQNAHSFGTEEVPLKDSLNRVLATEIFADRNYPPFNRSAMDGYAVRLEGFKKKESLKLIYDLRAGDVFNGKLQAGECVRIMTGAPVPSGADLVIKTEESILNGKEVSFTTQEARMGQNIAFCGEDMKACDSLLAKGILITAAGQASLAVIGHHTVPVVKLPQVSLFSTGSEVQPVDKKILPHHIRDSNSYALHGMLQSYRIKTCIHAPLPDDPAQLMEAFSQGLSGDIMIISGGVSKGVADYVPGVLKDLGVKELFHRVKIKPGNPLWVGIYQNQKIVFALPGNPVSVQVAFKIFIEPFIRSCFQMTPLKTFHFPLHLSRKRQSRFDEYFPAVLCEVDNRVCVNTVPYNGSGDVRATAHSDGIALHPVSSERLEQQDHILFYPWRI
jgi:molybdopterin molybdotransferase